MLLLLITFTLGFILILKGGDLFVDSSIAIAQNFNIPRFIIGGTIVSLATTTPELFVSTVASYMGDSGIAVGNAVGSAIANIGLIISITAILGTVSVELIPFKRRTLWMLLTTIFVVIFSWDLHISRLGGFFLLILALIYLFLNYVKANQERKKNLEIETETTPALMSSNKAILTFLIGIVLVISGSFLLVKSSIAIATMLNIPSVIIGLTAVAIGTSLPELITSIKSTKRQVADLAISNIIGANILNLGFITGISAIINPLTIDLFTQYYAFSWIFIMIFAIMIIFWKSGKMSKNAGIILLVIYFIYLLGLLLGALVNPEIL